MRSFLALGVFFSEPLVVHTVQRQRRTDEPKQEAPRCGDREAMEAMRGFTMHSYAALRSNPCVGDMDIMDPEDASEFLGKPRFDLEKPTCTKKILPSIFYLGMEHAGSTTLAEELNYHPKLSYGRRKEHRYFTRFSNKDFSRTNDEYLQEFEVSCEVERTFDATPNMFGLSLANPESECHVFPGAMGSGANTIDAVKRLVGYHAQFLVMLRDPLKVVQSRQWRKTVQENLADSVKFCKCFSEGIRAWINHFARDQFHFVRSEDLFEMPQKTLNGILQFLKVPQKNYTDTEMRASGRRRNVRAPPSRDLAYQHMTSLKPCQDSLEEITGLKLGWFQNFTASVM